MRSIAVSALALFATPLALAQEEVQQAPTRSAQEVHDDLVRQYKIARKEFSKDYAEVRENGTEEEIDAFLRDERAESKFMARFQEAARKFEKQEGAFPFLLWIVQNGWLDGDAVAAATETILRDHRGEKELSTVAKYIYYMGSGIGRDRSRELLAGIVELSPHDDVKLHARLMRAKLAMGRRGSSEEKDRELAMADLKVIAAEATGDLVGQAKSSMFELENLQIDMLAPDIAGEDLDGVPFKLSDYRGKVVVLDFWGDW